MKKLFYYIMACLVFVALPSCNDEDEIRKDIDALNARLDALLPEIEKLNTSINGYYSIVKGSVYVRSYVEAENGDYTFTLSDGTTMVVYSGKPAEDVPSVSINEEGYWCYLLNGNEVVLTDDADNNLYALPTNGKDGITPKISVNADGYWVYSLDGGQTWKLFESEGVTAVANPEKLPSSLFTDVAVNQENQTVTFTLAAGGDPVTVPLYTDMVFTLIDNTLSIDKILTASGELNITECKNVGEIVIEQTPLGIEVTNERVIVDATDVNVGTYKVYLRIISAKNNFAKLVGFTVTVTE